MTTNLMPDYALRFWIVRQRLAGFTAYRSAFPPRLKCPADMALGA